MKGILTILSFLLLSLLNARIFFSGSLQGKSVAVVNLSTEEETTPWKLSASKGEINVYTRSNPDSRIKEVRIKTKVSTSLENLRAFLADVPGYTDWVYKCRSAIRLETVSDQEFYYHTETDMPFPIKDRDLIVHSVQWKGDDGIIYSKSTAVPELLPENEKMIRIKHFTSNWTMAPQKDGTISIDYMVQADPGGNIPAWIINLAVTKGPLKTMEKLLDSLNTT